jgi:tetratricopeptide (TPR) repeat protein
MRQVLGMEKLVAPTRASGLRVFGWVWLVLVVATGFLVSSCGDDDEDKTNGGGGPSDPVYTAEELNEMGWGSFTVGDYYDAWDSFSQAVAKDGGLYEARLGLGWAQAYTGRHAEAVTSFQELIAGSHLVNDARAGLAAAALFSDPVVAEQAAMAALGDDEDYVFSRRTTFDYRDLHMILAEAYFAQQRYNLAQVTADLVAQMNGLPASGLDPLVPETWVVDGVIYATYHAALAAVIQDLSLLLSSHVPG